MIQKIIAELTRTPRRLFLIDGIGAIVSALMLGVVLPKLHKVFGLPHHVFLYLAAIAGAYAFYSICCYLIFPKNWKPYLKTISFLNFIYCFLTFSWLFYFNEQLTIFDLVYFTIEIAIILVLASVEWKTAISSD